MVKIALAIEREVDDTRSIRDMGASAKRKENQSYSSSRKKQKTSASHGSQGQGRDHKGQGQGQSCRGGRHLGAPSQLGQKACSIVTSLYILNGIVRRGRDPKDMGHHNPNHKWDSHRRSSFLLTP